MCNPARQGPTGSELLFVIAMIAMLVALLMPVIALAHSVVRDVERFDEQRVLIN